MIEPACETTASRRFSGVHGLHLGMVLVELLQGADCQELKVDAEAKEREEGIQEIVDVQCMSILGRAVHDGRLTAERPANTWLHQLPAELLVAVGLSTGAPRVFVLLALASS